MVDVPASPVGARARLPGRNPPPSGSCKGVFRPCPPAPLLVAGGTLTFLNSIPTLLSVFDFRTGSAIRGGEELLGQKSRKTRKWFCGLTPLYGGVHARDPIFSLQIGDLCVGVGFGKLSLLSVLSSRTEQKRPDFPPFEGKSDLLTQTNVHFRDTISNLFTSVSYHRLPVLSNGLHLNFGIRSRRSFILIWRPKRNPFLIGFGIVIPAGIRAIQISAAKPVSQNFFCLDRDLVQNAFQLIVRAHGTSPSHPILLRLYSWPERQMVFRLF